MRVYVGLILLAAYFCYSCLSQVEYNVFTDKLDWLAACIALRVVGAMLVIYLWCRRKICTILQQIRKQWPIPKEMSQTLLTNKKQGNLDQVQAANII